MTRLTAAQRRALEWLAGCPGGGVLAPYLPLEHGSDVIEMTHMRPALVSRRAGRGSMTALRITPAGRAALEAQDDR